MNYKKLILSVILLTITSVLICQNKSDTLSDDNNVIDSLIILSHIKKNVILLTFGSDAVSAIKTNNGIVVIDAGISTGLTLKYRKLIEQEFQSNEFNYVINTHYHPDHYGGNSIFENAVVIGHKNGIDEIITQWKDTTKAIKNISKIVNEYEAALQKNQRLTNGWVESFTQKIRYAFALKDAQNNNKISVPTLTFEDSLNIELGNLKFEMIHFGKCHSNSDILIFVPEMKMLFTGDLFFKYGRPSIKDEDIVDEDKWYRAVKWIEKRIPDIETIISGHGVILTLEDLERFSHIISENCRK